MSASTNKNVILGIGNLVLSDDGAGIKVVRQMMKNHPNLPSINLIDAGNVFSHLTEVLEASENLIVIEAAKLGRSPGTFTTIQGPDLDLFLNRTQRNANETALADIFQIVRLSKQAPENRALIVIEPKKTTWGSRLSACVSRSLPNVAQEALSLMSMWTGLTIDSAPSHTSQNQSIPKKRVKQETIS